MRSSQAQAGAVPAVRGIAVLLVLFAALSVSPLAHSQADSPLLVIVHLGVPDARVDANELRAIFLRKRTLWSNGRRIVPLNHPPGSPVRVAFDRTTLGFSGDQAARFWIDARIRYGTEAPMSIASEALLARVVKQLPGSIGYVRGSAAPAGVRVIARVDRSGVSAP
jgi:ABC-type phosphate transport system substrate-binding protein